MSESTQASSKQERRHSFEEALAALEDRVKRLDSGDLPLEEALRLFEEGVGLVRECQELLDTAEQRIIELTEGASGITESEYDPEAIEAATCVVLDQARGITESDPESDAISDDEDDIPF